MPCNSSDGMGDAYREDPQACAAVESLEQRIAGLEEALCGLCQSYKFDFMMHPQLRAWFEKHKGKPGCVAT
jgi:hypothetical protein